MSLRRAVDIFAGFATVAVAAGAISGSVAALLKIAVDADMAAPWSLPLGLDAVGVVAALAIRRNRRDWLAWAALFTATGLSTGLQVVTATGSLVNHLAHAVPPVAALVAFELFLRVTGTESVARPVRRPVKAKRAGWWARARTWVETQGRPAPSPVAAVMAEVFDQADPLDGPTLDARDRAMVRQERARRTVAAEGRAPGATLTVAPTPPAEPGEDPLLPLARRLAAEQPDGRFTSRLKLADALKAAGHPVGGTRSQRIHTHLKGES